MPKQMSLGQRFAHSFIDSARKGGLTTNLLGIAERNLIPQYDENNKRMSPEEIQQKVEEKRKRRDSLTYHLPPAKNLKEAAVSSIGGALPEILDPLNVGLIAVTRGASSVGASFGGGAYEAAKEMSNQQYHSGDINDWNRVAKNSALGAVSSYGADRVSDAGLGQLARIPTVPPYVRNLDSSLVVPTREVIGNSVQNAYEEGDVEGKIDAARSSLTNNIEGLRGRIQRAATKLREQYPFMTQWMN